MGSLYLYTSYDMFFAQGSAFWGRFDTVFHIAVEISKNPDFFGA